MKGWLSMTTNIQKWGNSQGIRLPKHLLDSIKWNENEEIEITAQNGKLVIEKVVHKERKNIKELFANFDGEYTPQNVDWGEPVGDEVW